MAEPAAHTNAPPQPSLADLQHWTGVMGRAQQMMMKFWAEGAAKEPADPAGLMKAGADFWTQGLGAWQSWMTAALPGNATLAEAADKDKRFKAPEWREPVFDTIRQSYLAIADRLLSGVEQTRGLDEAAHDKLKFAARAFVDAMSPSNFALTNPQVLKATVESGGQNLLKGLEHMLKDIGSGQLTHSDGSAFEVGRNLAATPGKIVKETPLFQLIHYAPSTKSVFETPLIIFPPWINRFYILDLTPEKSFVKWAVDQGLSVFMVSWKSADESIRDTSFDDYVVRGQVDAIDTVRDLLGVKAVHAIGYCVAGTTLAATLALLEAKKQAAKVRTATFFTAQVDFSEAGDLKLFLGDEAMTGIASLSKDSGVLDGRYMASTFNLLRGRDLIWNYVVNNYLLGQDYAPFELLHWNGDTTNLPAAWHGDYLETFYRGNKLAEAGGVSVDGTPIDLGTVKTATYVQAGREDHIAPPQSVFKITHHFKGPVRFVLAGSGHIAGVINPPAAGKYGYWINEDKPETLDNFIEGAVEHKGSWWPDWIGWLAPQSGKKVPAKRARLPGGGKLKAIEDAPGRYVKGR